MSIRDIFLGEQRRSYTFTCRLSTNSMTLNLLQTWRPIQVCNGIAYTRVSSPRIRRPRREAIHLNLLANLRILWVTPWPLTQVITTWFYNDAQGLFVNSAINTRVDRARLDRFPKNLRSTSEFQSPKERQKERTKHTEGRTKFKHKGDVVPKTCPPLGYEKGISWPAVRL
jgi:hypothetical protein